MTDPSKVAGAPNDALPERVAEANARARALTRRLSETAGRIAATETEVARVHEQIAKARGLRHGGTGRPARDPGAALR